MRCTKCGFADSKVVDSRSTDDGMAIRRRRECMNCEFRFTTYEKIEAIPITVVKKNGIREVFNRDKIINGILRACEKRPISLAQIEGIADYIESYVSNSLIKEIRTDKIGELISEKLKDIDDIAYVRFASVYRQFKDIKEFKEELNKLLE